MKNRLTQLLKDDLLTLDPGVLPETAAIQLMHYLVEWKKWNSKINLTSETDEQSVVNKHINESFQYTRAIAPIGTLADIGSGAGFPGIPIKVVFPELDIVLIESQRKRVNFLKSVTRAMGLKNIKCIHGRVEDFPDLVGFYDFVVLRHVLRPSLCASLGAGLLNSRGKLIFQTSRDTSLQQSFTNKIGLFLVDEIFVSRSSGSPSKLMVFDRNSS